MLFFREPVKPNIVVKVPLHIPPESLSIISIQVLILVIFDFLSYISHKCSNTVSSYLCGNKLLIRFCPFSF